MHEIPNDIVAQYADLVSNNFNFKEMPMEQKAFAIEYVLNGYNHRAAAKSAGMHPNRGIHLKRVPIVIDFILRLQERNVTESIVSKQSLDGFLDRIEAAAMGDVKVPIVLSNGAMVKKKKFHGSLAMDVYRERAKLHDIVKEDESSGIIQIEVVPSTRDSEGNDLP